MTFILAGIRNNAVFRHLVAAEIAVVEIHYRLYRTEVLLEGDVSH